MHNLYNLNPIEHFWALMKERLNKFMTPSKGIQELWERVCSIYPSFIEHDYMALYESMSRRIEE